MMEKSINETNVVTKIIYQIAFCLAVAFLTSSCATWNQLFGSSEEKPVAAKPAEGPRETSTKYSENPQMGFVGNRQYKKMTKSRMEEESDLGSQAGSMWVMEGQGSYLFAQNKSRREGDVLNIRMEGPAFKQVETKVNVIKKLLKQLEDQEKEMQLQQKLAAEKAAAGDRNPASEKTAVQGTPAAKIAEKDEKKEDKKEEKQDFSEIQSIQTRIVEKLPDGNYRIKGSQPFMIGKREYKVIVTGMIRPEDYNDEGVSSNKLLDPQFDVISLRKKEKSE